MRLRQSTFCRACNGNAFGKILNDANRLLQSSRIVITIPGNAVISLNRGAQRPENDSGVWKVFDLFAREGHAQSLGHKPHESWLEFGVLQNSRRKTRRLTNFTQPFTKAWLRLL